MKCFDKFGMKIKFEPDHPPHADMMRSLYARSMAFGLIEKENRQLFHGGKAPSQSASSFTKVEF